MFFWLKTHLFIINAYICYQSLLTESFSEIQIQVTLFLVCDFSFCNLLAETNHCDVLSCLISNLQKSSSPGIEFSVVFLVSSHSFSNVVERNNISLGDVFLCLLVSKMQKPPSSGFKPIIFFGVSPQRFIPDLKEWSCQIWFISVYLLLSYKRTHAYTHIII